MSLYKLSRGAQNDIFDIVTYTAKQWGETQALHYSEQLEQCMTALAKLEGAYKSLGDFTPPILVKYCEHHYIFGQQTESHFLVIAVLHERMDHISRVKDRLS